jgi:uncharacterized protein YjbJ (UPF0337 family)
MTAAAPAASTGVSPMSGNTDKIKGTANDVAGNIKKNVGEAIGDDDMQAEGAGQQVKGKAQKVVGDAKNAVKDAVNRNL